MPSETQWSHCGPRALFGTCRRVSAVRSLQPPPDRVTLDSLLANTRSCVGVKSLMTPPGVVKLGGKIL